MARVHPKGQRLVCQTLKLEEVPEEEHYDRKTNQHPGKCEEVH
jgi:hypothetical protein